MNNNRGKPEWTAEQTSVGVTPAYTTTMHFGETAGGVQTAIGATQDDGGRHGGTTTAFSAEQSAIGCQYGAGAGDCSAVCEQQGLSWEMIGRKCGW